MGMPLNIESHDPLRVVDGGRHHEHSPRTARILERTLKNGMVHPDVLLQYHTGAYKPHRKGELKFVPRRPPLARSELKPYREKLRHEDVRVQHVVQHSGDLHYPHGHMQGQGFVPKQHSFNSHVQVGRAPNTTEVGPALPTKLGPAARVVH